GGKPPRMIALTVDRHFVAVNSVSSGSTSLEDVLAKGGNRWYEAGMLIDGEPMSFEDKLRGNPERGITAMLPENVRLAEAMGDKNPFSGVFFDGGKTIILARSGVSKRETIERWVGSSITAGMLLKYYITGPDMRMGEEEMGWIVDAADKVQRDLRFPQRIL